MGTLFRGRRVLLGDGAPAAEAGLLAGADGRIARVLRPPELRAFPTEGLQVVDAGDLVLMPGLVDSHVHVNEPGRTDWEGFWTATQAAASGGVTTIVDMPLNSIPATTSRAALRQKAEAARGQLHVDVAFWGGVVPGNTGELRALVEAGVVGFKCFLCPTGVDEFSAVTMEEAEAALQELRGTGSLLAFHAECELPGISDGSEGNPQEYETYLKTRPPEMEITAIEKVADLCHKYRVRCHIVHLSAAGALPAVQRAKARGSPLSAETCHHYLGLAAERVPQAATQYKCCPPIRDTLNQQQLWTALKSNVLDMVVSDHSPATPDMKELESGDFLKAWGGIASLQFGLPLFWTAASERDFTLTEVVHLLCHKPAEICQLNNRKGALREGMDADLVIWDPDASFKVTSSIIKFKNKFTPYMNMSLKGKIMRTVVRGKTVFLEGKAIPEPQGQMILKCMQ